MPTTPRPSPSFEYPDAKRTNLPPAGNPPSDHVVEESKFAYDPDRRRIY
jgi:hypothetical protein